MTALIMTDRKSKSSSDRPLSSSSRKKAKAKHDKSSSSSGNEDTTTSVALAFENPTFQLPSDFEADPGRYELWTLRIPMDVRLEDLDGCEIGNLLKDDRRGSGGGASEQQQQQQQQGVKFESQKKKYQIMMGSSVENESFRLLVAQPNNNNKKDRDNSTDEEASEDDDEEKDKQQQYLLPVKRSFSRHINILESHVTLDERKLAPNATEAPKPVADTTLRRAYVPVAQLTNLRRRWQMPGSGITQKLPSSVKRERTEDSSREKKRRKPLQSDAPEANADAAMQDDGDSDNPVPQQQQQQKRSRQVEETQQIMEEVDSKPSAKRKLSETSIKQELVKKEEGESEEDKEAKKAAKRAKKEAKKKKKSEKKSKKEK